MTTSQRVEEIVSTFETECIQAHGKSLGQEHMNDWLRTALTEAYEAGRKEERERMVEWVRGSFQTGYVTMPQGGTHLIRTIDPDDLITHLTT